MQERYDLKKMLEEIKLDESQGGPKKGKMSQDMIQKMMLEKLKKKKEQT